MTLGYNLPASKSSAGTTEVFRINKCQCLNFNTKTQIKNRVLMNSYNDNSSVPKLVNNLNDKLANKD